MSGGWFLWAMPALFLVACNRDQITTYRAPKDPEATPPMTAQAEEPGRPQASWTTPAGWEQVAPGEMRVASFRIKGPGDKLADVSVIPLPGLAGGDLENVNRWRGQVGLSPVKEEELAKLAEKVPVMGETASLYDQTGQNPSENERTRLLAAILRKDGVAWFFKMTGSEALVATHRPAFLDFLKSFKLQAADPHAGLPPSHPPIGGATAPAASAGEAGEKPAWTVPNGWQETAPGQMQTAKFLVTGDGGAKAEVSVAVIPGDGGGPLPNANRWRRQIGLGPIEAADLPKQTTTLTTAGGPAMVLDVTSEDKAKRLIAASVPRGSQTWFYKLMGDEAAVAKQKAAFVQFVASAK